MATQIPENTRGLRACLNCRLVKNLQQFIQDGCDNCEGFLKLKNKRDCIDDYTSAKFNGMVAMIDPSESWVRKWKKMDANCVPGVYALNVVGNLSPSIERRLHSSS